MLANQIWSNKQQTETTASSSLHVMIRLSCLQWLVISVITVGWLRHATSLDKTITDPFTMHHWTKTINNDNTPQQLARRHKHWHPPVTPCMVVVVTCTWGLAWWGYLPPEHVQLPQLYSSVSRPSCGPSCNTHNTWLSPVYIPPGHSSWMPPLLTWRTWRPPLLRAPQTTP